MSESRAQQYNRLVAAHAFLNRLQNKIHVFSLIAAHEAGGRSAIFTLLSVDHGLPGASVVKGGNKAMSYFPRIFSGVSDGANACPLQ